MNHTKHRSAIALVSLMLSCTAAHAVDYWVHDFENDDISTPNNTNLEAWGMVPANFNNIGEGDLHNITNTESWSGSRSLFFNYNGRNSLCNTCGTTQVVQDAAHDDVDYLVADDGADLVATTGAAVGRYVFNENDGFARWRISGVVNENAVNDRLNLTPVSPGVTDGASMVPTIDAGDEAQVARRCGVDGTNGGQIDKRSDCNGAALWFGSVALDTPTADSGVLFRRQYMKHNVSSTGLRQKLWWYRPRTYNSSNPENEQSGEIILFGLNGRTSLADQNPNGEMYLSFTVKNGDNPNTPERDVSNVGFCFTKPVAADLDNPTASECSSRKSNNMYPEDPTNPTVLLRDTWYYLQVMYKPQTGQGVGDGEIKIWFTEAGDEPSGPTDDKGLIVHYEGMNLPPLKSSNAMSLFGNQQHETNSVGAWYIDDVSISDAWNPAVPGANAGTGASSVTGGPLSAPSVN